MSHHRFYAGCSVTSLLMFLVPFHAEASRWHLNLPAKLMDQVDPISQVFALDEVRLRRDALSIEFLSANAEQIEFLPKHSLIERPVTLSPVRTLADSHPKNQQAEHTTFINVQVQYLHTDLLGSVVLETDSNGNAIKSNTYKPFGESGNN